MWRGLLTLTLLAVRVLLRSNSARAQNGDELDVGSGPVVCSGECVGSYKRCAGKNVDTQLPCCSEEDQCVSKNTFYAQCRPKAMGIPERWPDGMVLEECTTGGECEDESAVTQEWIATSATWRAAYDPEVELDLIYDNYGTNDCNKLCLDNPECFVYEEDVDGNCWLYSKKVMEVGKGEVQGWFDASLYFVRCFEPEPLCKVGTPEVVEEDPFAKKRFAYYEDDENQSIHAEEDSMTACINICRLIPNRLPTCIGFLLAAPYSSNNERFVKCVPLFEDTGFTTGITTGVRVWQPEAGDRVFNIDGCTTGA